MFHPLSRLCGGTRPFLAGPLVRLSRERQRRRRGLHVPPIAKQLLHVSPPFPFVRRYSAVPGRTPSSAFPRTPASAPWTSRAANSEAASSYFTPFPVCAEVLGRPWPDP